MRRGNIDITSSDEKGVYLGQVRDGRVHVALHLCAEGLGVPLGAGQLLLELGLGGAQRGGLAVVGQGPQDGGLLFRGAQAGRDGFAVALALVGARYGRALGV